MRRSALKTSRRWLVKPHERARRVVTLMLLVVTGALLGGCGFAQSKKDAESVLARHFQAVATNGYDTAMADYGAQFFQKTTKEEWSKTLARLSGKLGAYQNHFTTGWRVFKNAGTVGAGTTVEFVCQVTYSKYSAQERFTLFKGVTDSDYKILGHHINSEGLLKE